MKVLLAILSITTKVVEGSPRELIVQEPADWGADLIVLGSRHGPLRQALLGSVATAVAADAACAVEIIRAGRHAVNVRQ
jgi:nucleotide-binding universal stress UspA family protein